MAEEKGSTFLTTYNQHRNMLLLAGFYIKPPSMSNFNYYGRRMVTFIISISFILSMTSFVITNIRDTMKITETLFVTANSIAQTVKLIVMIVNMNEIKKIEVILKNDILYETSDINKNMIIADIEKTRKNMRVYRFIVLHALWVYFVTPFLDMENPYRLPVPSYYPWEVDNYFKFVITFILQAISTIQSAIYSSTVDILFAYFSTFVYTEFKVLKSNLENLDFSANFQAVKVELRKNILLHLEILKISKAIENVFCYGILIQFVASTVTICFSGFHLTAVSPENSSNIYLLTFYCYSYGAYLACVFAEATLFCSYGQKILSESSYIGDAIYLSNWYCSNVKIRKYLIIMNERVKKPVFLTAGHLFPLTHSTLTGILKSSYSFLAVVQQTNNLTN